MYTLFPLKIKSTIARLIAVGFVVWFVSLVAAGRASAGELKLQSQLVWGTDGAKPDGKDLVELDARLKEKLKALRWKNYWVIKSEETRVAGKEPKKAMLGKCAVELSDMGNGHLEVKLFSVGTDKKLTLVRKVTEPIKKLETGGTLIIGGDSKDTWDDAWMVIITIVR